MAFSEEIFWAGITSIAKGQWEAARSTGLSYGQTLMNVVLPQALRLTIPPLTNRTIAITKGTALGTVVAVSEILGMASSAVSNSYNPSPLTLGALAYLILFFPMVVFGRWLETGSPGSAEPCCRPSSTPTSSPRGRSSSPAWATRCCFRSWWCRSA
jgi:polar amino acid transport system permease protein